MASNLELRIRFLRTLSAKLDAVPRLPRRPPIPASLQESFPLEFEEFIRAIIRSALATRWDTAAISVERVNSVRFRSSGQMTTPNFRGMPILTQKLQHGSHALTFH